MQPKRDNHPQIICYMPVWHLGYRDFLARHPDAEVNLVDESVTKLIPALRKDLRRVPAAEMAEIVRAVYPPRTVRVVDLAALRTLFEGLTLSSARLAAVQIIMPEDELLRRVVAELANDEVIKKIHWENIFLRWDSPTTVAKQPVTADAEINLQTLQQSWVKSALASADAAAQKSADWWRQVGAVIARDGKVLLVAYNKHVPAEDVHLLAGDPRGNFHKGEHIDLSTALHAEASLVAEAARLGLSLAGTELLVTTFPCPNCAKLIAYTGIHTLYYQTGYAMVDGERTLKDNGVQIVHVSP